MKTEIKIWEDRIFPEIRDNLVIHFEIAPWQNEQAINFKIFWKRNVVDVYIPERLFIHEKGKIDYEFANGIYVKGTLEIKRFNDPEGLETFGIFGDFYYYKKRGGNYIWHTEGFLIGLGAEIIIIEPEEAEIIVETIIRKPEVPVLESQPVISTADYTDLFPYIYVSGWPKISTYDKKWNFFYYTPTVVSPPKTTFYDKLAGLKLAGNRVGMQQESVYFIEGISPYEGLYVYNVNHLSGYIGDFMLLYIELRLFEDQIDVVAFVCVFFAVNPTDFSNYLKSTSYLNERERLWETYFALLIETGYARENLEEIIKVLITCNFLENVFGNLNETNTATTLSQSAIDDLLRATILLSASVYPLPPYNSSPPISPPSPIFPYAIGELQLVKYKLLGYQVGEMASVLSIMPGEMRKSVNRLLDRKINNETVNTSNENDTVTDTDEQSNDFNEELLNTLAETTETTNYPDKGLVSSYGPPTAFTISGSYTRTNTTQAPEKKQKSSFAKKILYKTTQRLAEKVSKVRSQTEWKESENISESVIDNQQGKDPIYAVHCWLNKLYDAKLVRYGNRMMFSFIVPKPADAFIRQTQTLNGVNLQEPKTLTDFQVKTYTDITRTNYLSLCQYYGIKNFPLPPNETVVVSDVIQLTEGKLISLPTGYIASFANLHYAFGNSTPVSEVNGFLGQKTFTFSNETAVGTISFSSLNNEQHTIPVGVVYTPIISASPPTAEMEFQMAVEITCIPNDNLMLTWQIEIYQQLEAASEEQYRIYHQTLNSTLTGREQINPQGERVIVKQELEKGICKLLLEYALQINGLSLNLIQTDQPPSVSYNQPEIIQYLKSAFEWDELSYTFFDEYDDQNGVFAVSSVSTDFFNAFLQSNYARVIIPTNPAFNYSMLFFLSTGMVWPVQESSAPCMEPSAGDPSSAIQPSIFNELKKVFNPPYSHPEIIDQWEVVVPTSMQILQNKKSLNIKNHA